MNRYLKLVHMEIHRFRYVLGSLMGITMIFQISALIWQVNSKLSMDRETAKQFPESLFSQISFHEIVFSIQFWFIIPILVSIAVLSLYVFLIWYRDWFGRNTFIYRLLMLPTARRHIYLAKLTAILTFVFSLVAFQLLLLVIEKLIFNMIVPADRIQSSHFSDVIAANQAFKELIPRAFDQFVFSYGLGIMALIIIFTAILIERSYRMVGIVYAALYVFVCVFAVVFPLLSLGIDRSNAYLYPEEIFGIVFGICAVLLAASVWLGFRLLSKKIAV
ncbi:hypothetical protein [Cohnella sp. WQ 127256]|uniref:hypothetical protein n=1 Tax=Cohnella sp. WQ 127256 TaxID=2938790 RepID=UPI0021191730|nr:hypothetical protein [Cohnella sp. WQ 127256]